MKRAAWVVDSSACKDDQLLANQDIYIIPINIIIDGESYLDGVNISKEEINEKIAEGYRATSSLPSLGAFVKLYKELESKYDFIFSFHASSKLSGTYATCVQAAQLVNIPIYPVDSLLISYPLTAMLKKAIHMWNNCFNIGRVLAEMEELKHKCEVYVLIGSLDQLYRSGRLSSAKYLFASMMNIKTIITFCSGELNIKEKARTLKQARLKIIDYLREALSREKLEEIYVLCGKEKSQADSIVELIERVIPDIPIIRETLGTSLSIHAGLDTVGVCWFNK